MDHVLGLIIDKLLKIDVEIQVELDEIDEIEIDSDQNDSHLIEKMVDFNGDSIDEVEEEEEEDNDDDDEEKQIEGDNNKSKVLSFSIKRMVNKMDRMMVIMMEYVKMKSQSRESLEILFQSLLLIFEKTVILTHKSKYTQ